MVEIQKHEDKIITCLPHLIFPNVCVTLIYIRVISHNFKQIFLKRVIDITPKQKLLSDEAFLIYSNDIKM